MNSSTRGRPKAPDAPMRSTDGDICVGYSQVYPKTLNGDLIASIICEIGGLYKKDLPD
jgi:hypothetical protein